MRIQWNPVYKAFHRICCLETNQFVISDSKVILTRQTCGQRSDMAAAKQTPVFFRTNLPYVRNIEM